MDTELAGFVQQAGFPNKGALCVALFITRYARTHGLPINKSNLLADRGGQVAGLGKAAIQAILGDYGIMRVLAEEGGRTSRGSIDNANRYANFLNAHGAWDMKEVEKWWIAKVQQYFASKPFRLNFDSSKSLRFIIRGILAQAEERQKENPGTTYSGTVLQHLIGAKLSLIMPNTNLEHHGASVADQVSDRPGDILIGNSAIHSTTAPGEALIRKCQDNLNHGLRPIIVTTTRGVSVAEGLAEQGGIADRVDVLQADQFIAGNIYEWSSFEVVETHVKAKQLVEMYNQIVGECETDPSLRIE